MKLTCDCGECRKCLHRLSVQGMRDIHRLLGVNPWRRRQRDRQQAEKKCLVCQWKFRTFGKLCPDCRIPSSIEIVGKSLTEKLEWMRRRQIRIKLFSKAMKRSISR